MIIKIFAQQKVEGGKNDQWVTAFIVAEGRKWMRVIWPDASGIRIRRVSNGSKFFPIDYSDAKAKRHLRRMGKTFGITKSARKALRV